jgi:hypothetical protein
VSSKERWGYEVRRRRRSAAVWVLRRPASHCGATPQDRRIAGAKHGTPPAASGAHVSSDGLGAGPVYFDHDDLGLSLRIGQVGGF